MSHTAGFLSPRCWQVAPLGVGEAAVTPDVQLAVAEVVVVDATLEEDCLFVAEVLRVVFTEVLWDLVVLLGVLDVLGTLMVVYRVCQLWCSSV